MTAKKTTIKGPLPRSEIIKLLKKGEHLITYKKQSTRKVDKMWMTLEKDRLPSDFDGKYGGANKEVIVALDTIKGDWRSFRVDSFKSAEPL